MLSVTAPFSFERLDKDKALLLIVDHQIGLVGHIHQTKATRSHDHSFS